MSLTMWKTEDPKLLEKHYYLLQKIISTVRRLLGDGDLPHAAADGVFWLLLTFVGWGKSTNEGLHSIRFKYLQVINQASKLLNKIFPMLLP